jgi:hypothetical protein
MLMNKKDRIIRAVDYLSEPKSGDMESFELPQSDIILMGTFGDTPDYSNPKFEELWQAFIDADDEYTVAYCLENGVDVLGKNGEPVGGFRDIAVMLKAIDIGLLTLADNSDYDKCPLLDTEVEHYG